MLCGACWQETSSEVSCSACGAAPLLDARYRLDAKLGQGASGIAFAATRLADGLRVCIKGLSFRGMSSFDAEKLFRREATVLRQIRHPQVPAYVDDFTLGAGPSFTMYLVQELVDGQDLEKERADKRPTRAEVAAIADEVLAIVEHLHDLAPPLVHRDIKLRNVMRRKDGRLVLVDFGAVKEVVHVSFDPGMSVQGTFGYMAPEQLRGEATPKSDLYAIGMVAVALYSGLEPAAMMQSTSAAHRVDWEPHVSVPEPLRAWLRTMTAIDPADRYRDATTARRALADAIAAREPEPAREKTPVPKPLPARQLAIDVPDLEPPAQPANKVPVLWWIFGLGILTVVSLMMAAGKGSRDAGSASSVAAPPRFQCNGPCRELSVPFKDQLRFGMSLDEAKAARPDIAAGWEATSTNLDNHLRLLNLSWLPSLDPEVPTRRVCADSELVGKAATCCYDFFEQGLGRIGCATTYGYAPETLQKLVDKVGAIYGTPFEYSFSEHSYIGFITKKTRWTEDKVAELEIEFDLQHERDPSEGGGYEYAAALQRMVMTHTSRSFQQALTDAEVRRNSERARAAAEAEQERAREAERRRLEREKLGLPPEPL